MLELFGLDTEAREQGAETSNPRLTNQNGRPQSEGARVVQNVTANRRPPKAQIISHSPSSKKQHPTTRWGSGPAFPNHALAALARRASRATLIRFSNAAASVAAISATTLRSSATWAAFKPSMNRL